MSYHRSRTEIYHTILSFCRVSRRKTEIVYGCNLNFKIIKPYIENLIKRGFMMNHDKLYFKTTDEGETAIDMMTPTIQIMQELTM